MLRAALVLLLLSTVAGAIRQTLPRGIAWTGQWPTSSTSAEDAYKMMAQPGDAPFASLQDAIAAQEKKSAVFLDARTTEEFAAGHIPGARNLPYYEMDAFQEAALRDITEDSPLIIYCEGIGCELSFFLARDLQAAGYRNLKIFYGGYPEWSQAGLPLDKGEAKP